MYYNFTEIMCEMSGGDQIPEKFYCGECGLVMTDEDSAHRLEKYFSGLAVERGGPIYVDICHCKHSKQKKEKLMVWHIPQIPGKSFNIPVDNMDEAKKILRVLADYDGFQFHNNIKPDYSNLSGLVVYKDKDDEWYEWYNENGEGIWSSMGDYPSITEQEKRLRYDPTDE